MGVQLHSLECGYSAGPPLFIEKTILFSWNCLDLFVKNQFAINVSIYFWTLDPITLSILMPAPHYLDYCGFVESFQIEKLVFANFPTNFVLF